MLSPKQQSLFLSAAFWGREAKKVRSLSQQPNVWLHPRTTPRYADRKATSDYADYPFHLWKMPGDIQLIQRVRLNTHRLVAIGLATPALGNTWWALHTNLASQQKKSVLLWLNSTLGLLLIYGSRVITEGTVGADEKTRLVRHAGS